MENQMISPCSGNVLIKPYTKPKETRGGFQLAGDQQNDAPVRGEVIAVGQPSKFQVGQTLFFRRYAVDELKYIAEDGNEETVWLVDEREVLAILEKHEA
jgi:co-chaperonin GroES (HSP10)